MGLNAREINTLFDAIKEIYQERERYNLEWAFQDAQQKLDTFKAEIVDRKLKSKCAACSANQLINQKYKGLQKASKLVMKKAKWYSRLFANMHTLLTLIEMIISVGLVLGLTHISHSGEALIASEWFSLAFVGTFAFLKVGLERYVVKPVLDRWGWALYMRTAETLREMTLALNDQATEAVEREAIEASTIMTFAEDWIGQQTNIA